MAEQQDNSGRLSRAGLMENRRGIALKPPFIACRAGQL